MNLALLDVIDMVSQARRILDKAKENFDGSKLFIATLATALGCALHEYKQHKQMAVELIQRYETEGPPKPKAKP